MNAYDALALTRMRVCFLKNIFRFREKGSAFKFLVISGFITGFWAASFVLFMRGFNFLKSFPGIGAMIGDRLLYIVFGIVFLMLVVSTAIVSYSTHYKSKELAFLFATPVHHSPIFMYKSLQAVFFSSWASVFLVSPMLLAYGIHKGLGFFFYVTSAVLFPLLVIISGMIGIAITMVIVGRIRGKMARALGLAVILVPLVLTFLVLYFHKGFDETDNAMLVTLNRLLHHTRIFLFPALPSYWLSAGLVSFGKHGIGEITFYFLLLLSTASAGIAAVESLARCIYYDSWLRSQSASTPGGSMLAGKIDLLSAIFRFVPKNLMSVAIKDIKTFLRDPQQWAQALIFLGLLFVYLINLRKMPYDIEGVFWKKLILFLNITSIITILGMLSTRFAFPLISFEGKRFWITLLSPLSLRQVVLGKFWVTGTGLFIMGEILVITLNFMLKTSLFVFLISSAAVALASLALAGLSIGIGTLFPDFRQDNFARISSGFGGTLLLILTLSYIAVLAALGALPVFAVKETSKFFHLALLSAGIGTISISLFCAIFPVSLGIRSLAKRDFPVTGVQGDRNRIVSSVSSPSTGED